MSLVGYDASSSDDEEKGATSLKQKIKKTVKPSSHDLVTLQRSSKTGIQITAPVIPIMDSDDSDDESGPSKKAKFEPTNSDRPRSGLFAKLPKPVNAPASGRKPKSNVSSYQFKSSNDRGNKKTASNHSSDKEKLASGTSSNGTTTSSVPSISEIRKRSIAAAARLISNTKVSKENNSKDDSDDEEHDTGFFSYVEKIPETQLPQSELLNLESSQESSKSMELAPDVPETSPVEKMHYPSNWLSSIPYENPSHAPEDQWDNSMIEDSKEMLRLQGKRNRNEELNFIDFHEEDALKGGKEMLLKTLTEEKGLDRTRVEVPGGMMKKKHQLPYLIQQAKAREVELKNTWAQNRQTKQQTQSKYGW